MEIKKRQFEELRIRHKRKSVEAQKLEVIAAYESKIADYTRFGSKLKLSVLAKQAKDLGEKISLQIELQKERENTVENSETLRFGIMSGVGKALEYGDIDKKLIKTCLTIISSFVIYRFYEENGYLSYDDIKTDFQKQVERLTCLCKGKKISDLTYRESQEVLLN